ncbi:DUF547 domain-containing protein [Flavobacterium sp. XS2P39]|uniref:DUF547 domain-containing protein n=1 Tax=Flavobacterium sp. XS2P39 TaxID=3401725 RepID=UPI003AAB2E6A
MKNYYTSLSKDILSIAKSEKDTTVLRRQLFYIQRAKLITSLDTDDLKKTFWINIYHAYYLIISKDATVYKTIFSLKRINIAGFVFSLNDIEHGILRKCKFKIGFGYITNPFYSTHIKTLAVSEIDYRIHFALRSGSLQDCPIDHYDCEKIDKQLTIVTKDFITSETEFDDEFKRIRVSKFIETYLRDFGGKKSIKKLLETIFKKDLKAYTLKFKNPKRMQNILTAS